MTKRAYQAKKPTHFGFLLLTKLLKSDTIMSHSSSDLKGNIRIQIQTTQLLTNQSVKLIRIFSRRRIKDLSKAEISYEYDAFAVQSFFQVPKSIDTYSLINGSHEIFVDKNWANKIVVEESSFHPSQIQNRGLLNRGDMM